jgi:hypothetical protein
MSYPIGPSPGRDVLDRTEGEESGIQGELAASLVANWADILGLWEAERSEFWDYFRNTPVEAPRSPAYRYFDEYRGKFVAMKLLEAFQEWQALGKGEGKGKGKGTQTWQASLNRRMASLKGEGKGKGKGTQTWPEPSLNERLQWHYFEMNERSEFWEYFSGLHLGAPRSPADERARMKLLEAFQEWQGLGRGKGKGKGTQRHGLAGVPVLIPEAPPADILEYMRGAARTSPTSESSSDIPARPLPIVPDSGFLPAPGGGFAGSGPVSAPASTLFDMPEAAPRKKSTKPEVTGGTGSVSLAKVVPLPCGCGCGF